MIDGTTWPTSEHYFQARKFTDEAMRERIRDDVMLRAERAKFSQHPELRELLLSTGNEAIVEHTPNHDYWGDGGDGTGRNVLGRILMTVREELRRDSPGTTRP